MVLTVVAILLVVIAGALLGYQFAYPKQIGGAPVIGGWIPWLGVGLSFVRDPKAWCRAARKKYGDVFVIRMFGIQLYFVFNPEGMKKLYQVSEQEASFSQATRGLLSLKVPEQITDVASVIEHCWREILSSAFKRPLMERYILNARITATEKIGELPASGTFELVAFLRKVVHKFAFRCWAGEEAATRYLERFGNHFDTIDPEQAFVKPLGLLWTILTGKRREKHALAEIISVLEEIWADRVKRGVRVEDLYTNLNESLPAFLPGKTSAEIHQLSVYLMVALQFASQTNLSSAASWVMINLLRNPADKARVLAEARSARVKYGDRYLEQWDALAELEHLDRCIYETVRIAQQSITLRLVRTPLSFTTAAGVEYKIPVGCYFGTLLNVLNTSPDTVPRPDKYNATTFCPDRFIKNRLDETSPGEEYMISMFGHGRHACPGERFSLHTIKIILLSMLERLDMSISPESEGVTVPETQMGAVARTDRPCLIRYAQLP